MPRTEPADRDRHRRRTRRAAAGAARWRGRSAGSRRPAARPAAGWRACARARRAHLAAHRAGDSAPAVGGGGRAGPGTAGSPWAARSGSSATCVEHQRERVEEVQLPVVADLGQRRGDLAPVEHAGERSDRVAARLAVQPPDPRPVLGRVQAAGEVQQLAQARGGRCRPTRTGSRPWCAGTSAGCPSAGRAPTSRRASGARCTTRCRPRTCTWSTRTKSHAQPVDRGDQPGEVARREPVVAVEVGDVAAARQPRARVAGVGEPDGAVVCDRPADRAARAAKLGMTRRWRRREPSSTTTNSKSGSALRAARSACRRGTASTLRTGSTTEGSAGSARGRWSPAGTTGR